MNDLYRAVLAPISVGRLLVLSVWLLAGCSDPKAITACETVGNLVPVCGIQRPEDMELLPDGTSMVISSISGAEQQGGELLLFDTTTLTASPLAVSEDEADSAQVWGNSECPSMNGVFAPHGIHLSTRSDGRLQLLVVNHADNERVEFFEIAESGQGYNAVWRGCVKAPEGSLLNDVVALPGGGFLVTHMLDSGSQWSTTWNLLKGVLGLSTGHVLHWDQTDFSIAPGTHSALPNGLQVSADGKYIFLNEYLGGKVSKISFPEGVVEAEAEVKGPDNIQWGADGQLLVASQLRPLMEIPGCFRVQQGACGAAFEIVSLDPVSMSTEVLVHHQGAPMGAATVAQQVGQTLYIGSFVGDRLLTLSLE